MRWAPDAPGLIAATVRNTLMSLTAVRNLKKPLFSPYAATRTLRCPHCGGLTTRTTGQLKLTPRVRCDGCHRLFETRDDHREGAQH